MTTFRDPEEIARIEAEIAEYERSLPFLAERQALDDLNAIYLHASDKAQSDWRATPATMAEKLQGDDPIPFRRFPYVDLLSEKIVDAHEGRSTRQIWNLPSRYGKTRVAKWGCVWILDKTEGRAKLMLVSYGFDLARETTTSVRDTLLMHEDVLNGQLRDDRRRQDRFVTDAGGGLLAAGIDGTIIGFGVGGGGGVFLDDPYKNWMEAHSETRRRHIVNQFKAVVRNRLDEESAFIIVIHHRMHKDDLTETLLEDAAAATGDDWEHVCLPALAYDDGTPDPLGRAPGEPLEPRRYTLEDVQARAKGMGTYLSLAMEQQRPSAPEGNELLRAWFRIATESELPRAPEVAITSWDLKLKDREAGDYVVGQVWWAVGQARFLMDQLRGQYDHPTTANAIALVSVRHPECKKHYIESAGSADEVLPELRKPQPGYEITDEMAARLGMNDLERHAVQRIRRQGMGNLIAEPIAQGSKSTRTREFLAPKAEAGFVRINAMLPGLLDFLDEVAAFPDGDYDDQVDTASQAMKVLEKPRGRPGGAVPTGQIIR